MYGFLFLFGFFGFVGMAGLGFLHSGHTSHSGHHGGPVGHGGARIGHHHGGARVAKVGRSRSLWALSPFDIFAYLVGAGAVGEILRQRGVAPNVVLGAAVAGALLFDLAVAKPLLGAILRFESRPSEGLEGSTAQRGEAATRFDAQGRGLVRLALDGQVVQVLGFLDADERARGVTVAKGDPLVVVDVDAARNTCRVTRELAS